MSEAELNQIRNDVLRALAERAAAGDEPALRYDRHRSGHSRNSDQRPES
ncbi:hypothetical protein ACFYVL_00375 [Streptomyces sp. NPDC004111]